MLASSWLGKADVGESFLVRGPSLACSVSTGGRQGLCALGHARVLLSSFLFRSTRRFRIRRQAWRCGAGKVQARCSGKTATDKGVAQLVCSSSPLVPRASVMARAHARVCVTVRCVLLRGLRYGNFPNTLPCPTCFGAGARAALLTLACAPNAARRPAQSYCVPQLPVLSSVCTTTASLCLLRSSPLLPSQHIPSSPSPVLRLAAPPLQTQTCLLSLPRQVMILASWA